MTVAAPTGYRRLHRPLLDGAWVAGELLCFAHNEARAPSAIRAAVAEPAAGPMASTERLLVVPGQAFIRFVELEPVHRRARLEVGVQGTFSATKAAGLLAQAVEIAFDRLNLVRVHGWVRPGHEPTRAVLAAVGFEREVILPDAMRLGGRLVSREIWAALR